MECANKRILLKISGESLGDDVGSFNLDFIASLAQNIGSLKKTGFQISIVVGAGNIIRGSDLQKQDIKKMLSSPVADKMGMLGTCINALILQEALSFAGFNSKVLSAFAIAGTLDGFNVNTGKEILEQDSILILSGGTGNPFFTTDTAAVLRAAELEVDLLIKATQVDGIYDKDPKNNPNAQKFKTLSFKEAIDKHLKVMDATAFVLANEKNIRIFVCEISDLLRCKNLATDNYDFGTLVA